MPKKKDTNYHVGKHTGYSLIDGIYHIAPAYTIQFNELAVQRIGIDEILGSVTHEVIADRNKKLWDRIIDDLGLEPDGLWVYRNGTIQKHESKEG